jgi:hypothetical protein
MSPKARNIDIGSAVIDLRNRTLRRLPCDFSRLIFLASTRDYNTGHYYHDGLAFHFSERVASEALAACHREIFDRLVFCSLDELIEELNTYVFSTQESAEDVLKSWKHLESYRVTVPSQCDELAAGLFLSNVRIALSILQNRQRTASLDEQFA